MIDWDRVSELRDEFGADDFREVVDMFLDEVRCEIAALDPDISPREMEVKFHFLKGASLNLGLNAFADMCSVAEACARKGQADAVDLNAITSCYRSSIAEFSSVLDSSDAA